MIGRALRRLAWTALVVWFVVTATFAMFIAIPADPAAAMLGPHSTPAARDEVRKEYGLDRSPLVQYGRWISRLAHGELGTSHRTDRQVAAIIADGAGPTALLAGLAIALQLLLGIPLGVLAAARRGQWPDRLASAVSLIGQSAPPFVVGTALIYLVAYRWDLLPLSGYGVANAVLPALTLACLGVASYARLVRSEVAEVLAEDHVRTARAKGLAERRVVLRHGLRPAAGPLVALAGLDLGVLLGGAVVVEQVFAWPGLGRELVAAILGVDLPVILGVVLVSAIAIAVVNLVVDVVQLALDPRLRG